MNDNRPVTKDELLGRIERARAALVETIEDLSGAQLEAREEGGWAITDHLLHLAVWEKGVADFLRGRPRAAGMGLSEEAWQLSMDEVNELIYEQTKGLSAAQARQKLEEAHQAMLEALAGLSDEDLMRPHAHFLPHGEEGVATQRLVLETIVANTYEHYDEHAQYIRQKLSQGPSQA
jgi:hypothetical protein